MSDLYKAQACYPVPSEVDGVLVYPAFEWVTGTLSAVTHRDGKSWLKTRKGIQRQVWTSSLELVAETAEPEATPRGKILREAEALITGDRNKNYGSPTENFDTTAALWNAQLGHKLKPGESFTATDVALLMVQLKMARLKTSTSNRDHYLDIAGYIACGFECQEVEDASA